MTPPHDFPPDRPPYGGLAAFGPVDRLLTAIAHAVRRRWNAVAIALFAAFALAVTAIGATVTDYNWDILPYAAVAHEGEVEGAEALHAKAYAEIRAHADDRSWHQLVKGYAFREAIADDPEAFVSQLGMYRVKVVYTALLSALSKVMNTVTAAMLINAVGAVILTGAVFLYMRREGAAGALPFAIAVMLVSGTVTTVVGPMPDTLAAALAVAGVLLFASGRPWLAGAILILAALTRTDNVIVMFALVLTSVVYGTGRIAAVVTFAAGLAAVLFATQGAGHPGWWPHFYHSVVALQVDMRGFAPAFDPLLYAKTLIEQAAVSFYGNTWAGLIALIALTWGVLAVRGLPMSAPARAALLAAILAVLGKFVVFPLPVDRVYYAQSIAAAVILLAAARPTLALPTKKGAP